VRAMKEFSHPGGDEKTPTDINQAIRSTIEVSRNEWKYHADLVADLDPALPLVPCLPNDFNQVVLNLIVNAAHAIAEAQRGGEKGTITVRTRAAGGFAQVSVADTGTGIPEAIRHRIFEPFFTTKEVGKGTGQGLAIAYAVVVDRHGGHIDVDSREGRGTTFTVHLPLVAPRPAGAAP
jgi:signal transduction histidine kinase